MISYPKLRSKFPTRHVGSYLYFGSIYYLIPVFPNSYFILRTHSNPTVFPKIGFPIMALSLSIWASHLLLHVGLPQGYSNDINTLIYM